MKQHALAVMAAFVGLSSSMFGALGEVLYSGSSWIGRVDGSTKYTGSSSSAANNACMNAMSSGTVMVRNNTNGFYGAWTKSNCIIDGTGKTFGGGGTNGVVYANNSSNIGARNLWLTSTNWYGIFFRTNNGQNISGTGGTANLTFRIDNCKGGTGYSINAGSPSDYGASGSRGSHHFETYGQSGTNTAGTITGSDRGGGCGVLLNYTSNFNVTLVDTWRCNWGGGYAGFRTANTNGKTIIGSVKASSCGRGYFSVSGSRDCTVSTIDTWTTSSTGVWLQTTYNTRVNSGTVRGGNPCSSISAGSGNSISVSCQ